jgi:hypothetical protein
MIETWNVAGKDNIEVEVHQLDWSPDYNLVDHDNPVFCFIKISITCCSLNLNEGVFFGSHRTGLLYKPTALAMAAPWYKSRYIQGKVVVDDSVSNPFTRAC